MNNKIRKSIIFLLCLLWSQVSFAAAPIGIEVKAFGQDVAFIFYRNKNEHVDIKNNSNHVAATLAGSADYKLLNAGKFSSYAKGISLSNKKQTVSFNVSNDLIYQSIINGEKFDAIIFKSKSMEKEDLGLIGSANNAPGGIKYISHGDQAALLFNMDVNDSKVAAFVRGEYLWIVFDKHKILTFKEQGIFSAFEPIASENGTVLRFKFKDHQKYHMGLEKIHSGWQVIFTKHQHKFPNNKHVINFDVSENKEKVTLKGDFGSSDVISFEDPEVGDKIIVIPVANNNSQVIGNLENPEFSILPSVMGVAACIHSDEVTLNKQDNILEIISASSLHNEEMLDSHNFPGDISEAVKLPTILPHLDKNLDILDFNTQKSRLISEASMAESKAEIFTRNLAIARFFFINGWYQESLDALFVPKTGCEEEYKSSLEARFMAAVNYTMLEENDLAKPLYEELLKFHDVKDIPEINLWNKYNDFAMGANPGKIGFLENSKIVKIYSDDKYWTLAFAEIELALLGSDIKLAEKLFKELRPTNNNKYNNSIKFYKAQLYRKKNQLNLAKQLYKELTNKEDDEFNRVRAEFDLTKLRVKGKEMKLKEAIDNLENIRFAWRGDQLEYEILVQLASYYRENNDIMNALRIYKYIQEAFDNKISNFYITSEMAKIFNDVFLSGGIGEKMDDFTIVALFYEFKELNPIGDQGDEVILAIAKRLVHLDLLENAADLLGHQITYRLHGERKIEAADNLAIILMMDRKPAEAIKILNDTDIENINFKEHQYRVRLKAKALVDLSQYDRALDYLKDDDGEDAEVIRKEALFQSKKWSDYIDEINAHSDQIMGKVATDPSAVQDIVRLAIAYHVLNLPESLKSLSEEIGDKNVSLKNIIDLLATSSNPLDYRHLDKSLNIDQMKILLDKYQKQLLGK